MDLGGIYVEIFKDVSFRICPVDKENAKGMIEQLKSYPILAGARGRSKRDIEKITECIIRLSQLAIDFPQIMEMDINPLIVLDQNQGCFVADAKIVLKAVSFR